MDLPFAGSAAKAEVMDDCMAERLEFETPVFLLDVLPGLQLLAGVRRMATSPGHGRVSEAKRLSAVNASLVSVEESRCLQCESSTKCPEAS